MKTPTFEQSLNNLKSALVEEFASLAAVTGFLSEKTIEQLQKTAERCNLDYELLISRTKELSKKNSKPFPEVELLDVNKKKGDLFESFMVDYILQNPYLHLTDWRGDKCTDTKKYPLCNCYPDLGFYFVRPEDKLPDVDYSIERQLYIECKWRASSINGVVTICKDRQLRMYRDQDATTFLALGLAGEPSIPERLFIIPIDKIQDWDKVMPGVQIRIMDVEKYECKVGEVPYYDFYKTKLFRSK